MFFGKPKIAMLALYRGGIGHYIAELSPHLSKYFDLEYISYKYGLPGDEVTLDDIAIAKNIKSKPEFIVSYNNYKDTIVSLGKTIDFLKKKRIDILNIHISTMTRETVYFVVTLISVAKSLGIKIHFTYHDVGSFENYEGGAELLRTFYKMFDSATVGNEEELKKLKGLKISTENVAIARHGLYNIFDFRKYNQDTAKKYLNIPLGRKVILNFGILRDYKGFDDTVKAMPEVLKKVPNAYHFISAGVRVHDCSQSIKGLVKKHGLTKNTKLSFDFVDADKIEPIFKASDIVVLPYRQVSQSGILNLALNFHKPVILSDLFAESNKVDDKMGIIVPPGNPSKLSDAMVKLLSDEEFYDKCKRNMEEYTKNDRTWQENAESVKNIINKVLKQKK